MVDEDVKKDEAAQEPAEQSEEKAEDQPVEEKNRPAGARRDGA